MYSSNNDFIAGLIKAAIQTNFLAEVKMKMDSPREYFEHHPSIKTVVTDKDMLLIHIDMALDAGDMEMFMRLTDELRGMEVPV